MLKQDLVLEKKIAMNVVQNFPKNSTGKGVSELGHLLSFLVLSLSPIPKNPGVLEE